MEKEKIQLYDVLKNPKLNFCGFVTGIAKYISLKDLHLKPATFDAAYLEPATPEESAAFAALIAAERENLKPAPAASPAARQGGYAGMAVGAAALCRTTDNYGLVTDVDPAHGKAKLVRSHAGSWWVPLSSLDLHEPPPLQDGLRFGQFVTFPKSPGEECAGKLLEVKDGKYTALGADGKCYPKGQRYADGDLYDISDIRPVSAEAQEKYLFKLNRRHTPEEYADRLARTKAGWAEKGFSALLPKFDIFWNKVLSLIGDHPGATWGARVRTIYGHSPTLNIPPDSPEDLQNNMVCFFTLSADGGQPEFCAFIKDYSWIPDAARRHYPAEGDKKFYAGGNRTVIPLAGLNDAGLVEYAVSMAAIHKAACDRHKA